MIPIRSTIKTEIVPYVNYTLIAVNIMVFAYTLSLTGQPLEMFYQTYGIVPSKITSLSTYGFFDRTAKFFSCMFVHENWLHIAGNLIFLYIFGKGIEDFLGHMRYLLFYLVCGLAAVLIQVTLNSHSTIPAIGASGAISGVLGAYMLFFPRSKILTLLIIVVFVQFVRIKAYLFIIFWFAVQFLTGIGYIGDAGADGLWAHLGGFACGMVAGGGFLHTKTYRRKEHKAGYGPGWYRKDGE